VEPLAIYAGITLNLNRAYIGALCVSLQPLLVSAIALPVTAYVIRTLGATQYGHWATTLTLVTLAMLLCNLGLRGNFVRAVVRHPDQAGRLLAEQLGLRLALCLPAAVVALTSCLMLGYPQVVLACTAIAVLWMTLNVITTTAADLLQARHRLAAVAGVNGISGVLLAGVMAVAAYAGSGPLGVAGSYTLGALVAAALMLGVVARAGIPLGVSFRWQRAREMLWGGRHLGAQLLLNNGANQIEHVLVPRLMGATLFGQFAAGALLSTRLQALPDGAASAAYSAIAEVDRTAGRPAARRVFLRFLGISTLGCVAASTAVSFLVEPVSTLLFPNGAETCAQVMRITIWSLPLVALVGIFGSALNALGHDALQARVTLVASLCHLVLASFLIWNFGIIGAAWSIVGQEALWLVFLTPGIISAFRT
jgi:O-antigen/teichoic acid export membrane protein